MKFGIKARKAVSPIIATIIIVAVTLVAGVAIGGYVFGLFGSQSNTAQVQAVAPAMTGGGAGTGTTLVAACAATATAPDVAFSNAGTAAATILQVAVTFNGKTYTAAPTGAGLCVIGASGSATSTVYINFTTGGTGLPFGASGNQFTGYVALNNGAQVVFTGVFA